MPYHTFSESSTYLDLNEVVPLKYYYNIDTATNLTAGQTYYVRVTDQCGVFYTKSITIPTPSNTALTYDFTVSEPIQTSGINIGTYKDLLTKSGCPEWGKLSVFSNGVSVTDFPANHGSLSITVTIKRQDNGNVIETRTYGLPYTGTDINFDSIPRVSITVTITDACGNTTNINKNPLTLPAFKLQAYTYCNNSGGGFVVYPYLAARSHPIYVKVYDAANIKILDTIFGKYDGNQLNLTYNTSTAANSFHILQSTGLYHIVYVDDCGRTDSIDYNFAPGVGTATAPAFSYQTYQNSCVNANYYTTVVTQTVASPLQKIVLTSGPAGVTYPKLIEYLNVIGNNSNFFDSLVVGTYQFTAYYGCNQSANYSFTVGTPISMSYTGTLSSTINAGLCTPITQIGNVSLDYSVSANLAYVNPPFIRITQAPTSFLNKIARSKNGSAITTQLELGFAGAYNIGYAATYPFGLQNSNNNGIDTTLVNTYSNYTYYGLSDIDGMFDPGTYTFQMYEKCTGNLLATNTFTIAPATYALPTLGASSAYICDNGKGIKLIASPLGGTAPYQYQIKLASDPDVAYTPLQTSNLFLLPAGTAVGSIHNLRVVDNCGNSFVGQVTVNSFTGQFIISASGNCINNPEKFVTGFIPGATYTWTKPDGTVIVTTTNQLNIANLTATDIGTYKVSINALNGCIQRLSSLTIGNTCSTLALTNVDFKAIKNIAGNVSITWKTTNEANVNYFEVQRSIDGVNFYTINTESSKPNGTTNSSNSYNFEDITASTLNKTVIFYRLKQVEINNHFDYSNIAKIIYSKDFYISTMYPVPFSTNININLSSTTNQPIVLNLQSIEGKQINSKIYNVQIGDNTIKYVPNSSLKSGVYIIKVTQGTNTITQKITCINN